MKTKQAVIDPEVLSVIIEQKIAAGSTYDGAVPADAVDTFVPFFDDADGIWKHGKPDETTFEGIHGGLFELQHKQPLVVHQILADLGTSLAYTISLVTSAGDVPLYTGTNRYIVYGDLHWRLAKGEKIKVVVAAGTAAMWLRVYARLEQAVRD